VLLSLAMTFGVAEVGFRVYDASTRRATLAGRDPDTLDTEAVDDARIYRMRPNRKGLTNGHGFRDLPRTRRKAEGTYRIAVIGDSVTMQATIDFDDLYPTRLQRALNERLPDASIEVLNFGVSGYSTRQQLAVLRAEVLSFEPDALLWQFHLNDAVDPLVDGADGGLGRYHARPRSAFLAYLQRRWHRLHRKRIARAHGLSKIHSDFQHQVARWDDVSTAFGEVAELAAEHGFEVFIFLYPTWPDTDWDEFSPEGFDVVDSLVRRFESLGFATLDLVGVFRSESPARYRAAADDPWHPNRAGHARIADELARWLVPMISRYGASGGAGDTDAPDRPGDDGPVPHGMMPMSDADTRDDD
jgi:lysophospholipase L1-like esterase